MVALCRTNETCRRLAKLPGVGPVIATAIVAAVNDGRQFRSGREMGSVDPGWCLDNIPLGASHDARRHRTTRQPLPQSAADPRRAVHQLAPGMQGWRRRRGLSLPCPNCRPSPAAIVAAVNDGRQFRSGREMAAWTGLVPRQYTTGASHDSAASDDAPSTTSGASLIHGARAVVSRLPQHDARYDARRSTWLKALVARRGFNRTIVALSPTKQRAPLGRC